MCSFSFGSRKLNKKFKILEFEYNTWTNTFMHVVHGGVCVCAVRTVTFLFYNFFKFDISISCHMSMLHSSFSVKLITIERLKSVWQLIHFFGKCLGTPVVMMYRTGKCIASTWKVLSLKNIFLDRKLSESLKREKKEGKHKKKKNRDSTILSWTST